MQSDQKIGICLLIGLVGFAAALGFGRRPRPEPTTVSVSQLRPSSELFEELAPVDAIPARPTVDESPATIELTPPSDLASSVAEENVSDQPLASHAATLAPVAPEPAPSPAPAIRERPLARRSRPQKTYVVQPGDTLTGIAARHLGDANRYLDVYEANRDTMANPDALQVGQAIVLPLRGEAVPQTADGETGDYH